MAAYLSLASFIPIIYINPQARLSPVCLPNKVPFSSQLHENTNTKSSAGRPPRESHTTSAPQPSPQTSKSSSKGQKTQTVEGGSETFPVAEMSIFASQPMQAGISVPPPSYSSSRRQPPSHIPSSTITSLSQISRTTTNSSTSKTSWFSSIFSSTSKTNSSDSPTSVVRESVSLPPVYKPTPSATIRPISTSSSRSSMSESTISTQPSLNPDILPRYEAIKTTSTSPTSLPSSNSTSPAQKPTWQNPYVETDPYEEYELQHRIEREGAENLDKGDWCCGCFWIGPAQQPWQAYYIY